MGNLIEQQAIDFANVPIIQKGIRASVHLEDWEDVLFWDTMIQRVAPGRYNYLAYSKSDSGERSSGSSQCLKYAGYLSNRFFVCIDSDMHYLLNENGIDSDHFISQTYTYSWENHYCEATHLQARLTGVLPTVALKFDFVQFLSNYSHIIYRPLLALLYCLRIRDERITRKSFAACLPHQCKSVQLAENGSSLLREIEQSLNELVNGSSIESETDFEQEEKRYKRFGLTKENAYLHIRGHNLYDLLKSIGYQLCSSYHVDFENQILNRAVPGSDSYWEIRRVDAGLREILSP